MDSEYHEECSEEDDHSSGKRLSDLYFTDHAGKMQVLPHLFDLFYTGGRKVWFFQGQFTWH